MNDAVAGEAKLRALSTEKARLVELLLAQRALQAQRIQPLPRAGVADLQLPASWAQQRLWFIDQLEGGGAAYNIPIAIELRGALNEQALHRALDTLVQRHETLRTVFVNVAGEPQQRIEAHGKFTLRVLDLSAHDAEERSEHLQAQRAQEARTSFDLHRGPLIRGCLLRTQPDEHTLLITMHHIVSDGWSMGVFVRELTALYAAYHAGRGDPLQPLAIQYADYAAWQRQWLQREVLEKQLHYWRSSLAGAPLQLELPADRARPAVQGYRGGNVPVALDAKLGAGLKALAQRNEVTLFMVLYAAWAILLARLSGQDDISIGTPTANRRHAAVEGLIGLFVNMLVLRVNVDGEASLEQFLRQVKGVTLGAYDHQDMPFERVVEALRPARSLSRHPLFQAAFALQNAPKSELHLPGLAVQLEESTNETAKFDLLLSLEERGEALVGYVSYDTDLFERHTVERWVDCYTELLRTMAMTLHGRVGELRILPHRQRAELDAFNATASEFPRELLMQQLFEAQAQRTPERVAVACGAQSLTYAELDSRANQLAHYLRACGVGADCFVGVCIERGIDMVVSLLGVLKAGGAYVPLDPSYPQQRLRYMLEDTAPKAVLTQERLQDQLPPCYPLIMLDTHGAEVARQPRTRPAHNSSSSNLAYVIYTSGSTGKPKGVAIEHRQAVNFIWWARSAMPGEVFERTLLATSLNFDLSVYECFVPLSVGGCVQVVQNALALLTEPVSTTLVNTVPSAIKALLDAGGVPRPTQVVNLAGEALKRELVERIFAESAVVAVNNLYGPSETTTYSTWVSMPRAHGFDSSVGRPIANTQVYILDRYRHIVPIGVVGEIHIGGAGVARGYLNRPELTAERFLNDPFSADPQARMYKTGDLGRWRADGTIEYLGRNDHQVKLRGFRIELGEIEAQLTRHPLVAEAGVIAREDTPGEKRLVAYVVVQKDDPAGAGALLDSLRTQLRDALPEHMLPSAFVTLERLPLTANGKLDRQALPAPQLDAYASTQYEAPQGRIEEALAGIWQALLHVEQVGRHDNFFELGGHSLMIVQMMERLRQAGLATELRSVFANRTLAELAGALAASEAGQQAAPPNLIPADCTAIVPAMLTLVELDQQHIERIVLSVPQGAANIQDVYPLTPLQEGILFHHLFDEAGGDTYVLPMVLCVSSRDRVQQLSNALQTVIDRHDVLRTAVLWEQLPRPVQVVYRRAVLPIEETVLDAERELQEQITEWIKPEAQRLDLRHAPLLRLKIAPSRSGGEWYVLLQLHHMTIDHIALEIIITQVIAELEGRSHRAVTSLPYRDHVAQSLAYARRLDAREFFRGKLGDVDEPTAPFGLLDVHGDGTQVEEAREELAPALAQRVRVAARRMGVSSATLFHAAWALVVAHTSRRDDVVFGSVLLGRLHSNAGAQQALGMFINTLPLRLQLSDLNAQQLIERTQRELAELLDHEQASLTEAQRCSRIVGSAPLFSALFNYRHSVPNPQAEWSAAAGVRAVTVQERTNYPITLSLDDLGEGFRLVAQTDRRIDPRRVNGYLRSAVESLLHALEREPQAKALELPVLPHSERHELLALFNATRAYYSQHESIDRLVEEQVLRSPDRLAVTHDGQALTYADLNRRANQLARYLRDHGVESEQRVGICVERGLDMIVGLLAILKAGGAYVPLDPNYPAERLQHMLDDAAPTVVLTQAHLLQVLPRTAAQLVAFEAIREQTALLPAENLVLLGAPLSPRRALYVIYTSGSTGRPKGIVMPHHAMVNLMEWHREHLPLQPGERVLQFAALSFDVAFQEVFSTLSGGGTLVLLDEWVRRDARALLELLARQGVARLFIPPLMLQTLAECLRGAAVDLAGLRDVITAGEQLRVTAEIVGLFEKLGKCRLHNHYGPTETHVVTALTLAGDARTWPILPLIGAPIANSQIYVLDERRQPAPLGVAGEIYIAGANVARGYFNRPELTAARFLADPFAADSRVIMYKSGDLGRWCADGSVEYLGRNDDQVKIRGFRVELGEIESQLVRHPLVKEAAVVALEHGGAGKRLVAYLTRRGEAPPHVEELRAHLSNCLPEYMVPSAFVVVDALPLTPSGKLNRRALPAPQLDAYASSEYEAPQGATEETLARIWQEVLGVERIGRCDDFFELGGHSLLALKALLRINESFGSTLRITDLYKSPKLYGLAARLGGSVSEDDLVDLAREAVLDDSVTPHPGLRQTPAQAVLLTGASGFVGRFLLTQLLHDTGATVYCLVRAQSQQQASARLKTILSGWNLWCDDYERRVVVVAGDLRAPRLGMDAATYRLISQTVDSIYHCATSMNHLESYSMAKAANVEGTRELLRLATQDKPKLINYISTLGVFNAPVRERSRVVYEDSPIDREQHPSSSGYAASKWVGEKIFMLAAARGIPCNIFRLGLVWADTQQGRFDELQTLYRILKSCLLSGHGIQQYQYPMPPTPVDFVARAVVFLGNCRSHGGGIFHISGAEHGVQSVFERSARITGLPLKLKPYYQWISEMKRLHQDGRSLPAVPLIEFAFSMDEPSFMRHQRSFRSAANIHFDCTRTLRELERGGIVAPMLDDALLELSLKDMFERDAELRGLHE